MTYFWSLQLFFAKVLAIKTVKGLHSLGYKTDQNLICYSKKNIYYVRTYNDVNDINPYPDKHGLLAENCYLLLAHGLIDLITNS